MSGRDFVVEFFGLEVGVANEAGNFPIMYVWLLLRFNHRYYYPPRCFWNIFAVVVGELNRKRRKGRKGLLTYPRH